MSEVRSPKSGLLSLREKRILRYIILFVIVTRIALAFRPEERIYTRPYSEDSFYLFTCAEHIAQGDGFTCDGKQPTNGVQPLIVLFYVPLFLVAGANKLLALRLGFIFVALFDSLSIVFLVRLVKTLQKKPDDPVPLWKSPAIIAAILWAALYPLLVFSASGLETGLYSALLVASLYYYSTFCRERDRGIHISNTQWIGFGVLLGLTVLARIDGVLLVIAIAIYELYKTKKLQNAIIICIMSFLVSSPWWWYNYHVFGSIMPQSGIAESLASNMFQENLQYGAIAIADILAVFFVIPIYAVPEWFDYFWFAFMVSVSVWVITKLKTFLAEHFNFRLLMPYYFFCGALIIYYIFFFSAPYFLARYLHPFRILWIIIAACTIPNIIVLLSAAGKKTLRIVAAIIVLAAAGFGLWRYTYYFTITQTTDFLYMGKYALAHPQAKFAMWQSGTTGFIAPNIANLDGKVNFEALQAVLHHDIGNYIERQHFDYIADWDPPCSIIVREAEKHGGKFQKIDSIGRVVIYKRIQ